MHLASELGVRATALGESAAKLLLRQDKIYIGMSPYIGMSSYISDIRIERSLYMGMSLYIRISVYRVTREALLPGLPKFARGALPLGLPAGEQVPLRPSALSRAAPPNLLHPVIICFIDCSLGGSLSL